MRVTRDVTAGTVTFQPTTDAEREMLERIATVAEIGARFKYVGYDEPARNDLELYFRPDLHLFGSPIPIGSLEFCIRGSTEDDRKAVGALRDALFYGGSAELILTSAGSEAGTWCIVMTAMYCARCGAAMIDRINCEWACDACAARCAHKYERGAVHGGKALVEMDEYCTHCGRVRPSEKPPRTPEALVQEAEQELGVIVLENTSLYEIGQHLRALTEEPS